MAHTPEKTKEKENEAIRVFISVTPKSTADEIRISRKADVENDLQDFIDSILLKVDRASQMRSDNWIFCYMFPDEIKLPRFAQGADRTNGFNNIRDFARNARIRPSMIVPLRDALYCQQYGIDLFSDQAQHHLLTQAPGYKALSTQFGIFNEQGTRFPTCRAVDTGFGVLLYDLSQSGGRDAYNSFMRHCTNHFFDNGFGVDRLRFFELHTFLEKDLLEGHCAALNFNFDHHRRDFTMKDLAKIPLFRKDILHEGFFIKEYDMSPQSQNFMQFLEGESLRLPAYTKTLDIALLDQFAHQGLPMERLSSEWRFICSYTANFKELSDEIVNCDNPQKVQSLQNVVKILAQTFLDKDFPDRRSCPDELRTKNKQENETPVFLETPSINPHKKPKL